MRDRKTEEQKPTNTLRRSPRFLHGNRTGVENPRTPNPAPRRIIPPDSFSTPVASLITKTQKNGDGISQKGGRKVAESRSLKKSSKGCRRSTRVDDGANLSSLELQKQCVTEKRVTRSSARRGRFVNSQDNERDEISGKRDRKVTELKSLEKSGKGSKRSIRLESGTNVSKNEVVLNSQQQYVIEKRVTRSSFRQNKFVNNEAHESVDSCKQSIDNTEKRVTRSFSRTKVAQLVEKASNVSADIPHKVVMAGERKPKDDELSKLYVSERDVKECSKRGDGDENCKKKIHIGEKRKRVQVEEECEIVQGWTKEQELALQRAYFTAKPTPHFWKKVARMVPGKSAEECFDRIHSDHLTPSQPRTRSRTNRKKPSSPISFSASKLLSPAEMKTKKLRSGRRKTLLAQKTVRQLLQKQQNEDQDYEADFFSVLEPTMDLSSLNFEEDTAFPSPAPSQRSGVLTRCRGMSSSAHKKHLSRLHRSQNAAFVSPPVLKQIKNKALHEKYIDQLHYRDAKRKAESLRNAKSDQDGEKASLLKVNSVKVAKDALVSDAQYAINQIRSLQANTKGNIDDDDITIDSDDDEDEDELF